MEESAACLSKDSMGKVIDDQNIIYDQWEFKDSLEQLLAQNTRDVSTQRCYTSLAAPNPSWRCGSPMAEIPRKVVANTSSCWNSRELSSAILAPTYSSSSSSSIILSFGNSLEPSAGRHGALMYGNVVGSDLLRPEKDMIITLNSGGLKRSRHDETMVATQAQGEKVTRVVDMRSPHLQDHVIAERKRREKLSQKFIALSAVVPDLKKMDKSSILEEATRYMKRLQEKVKNLEDQAKKSRVSSAVLVEKSQVLQVNEDCTSSCDENPQNEPFDGEKHPEMEVKVYDSSVYVRIHCKKYKGVVVKVLTAIENLNLTVTNMSVIPFARSALDITVMVQIGEGFSMEAKELVKELNSVL